MAGKTPALRITLNGTVYPCADYRTTSIEPLEEKWDNGFIGGLGAYDMGRAGRDRYFSSHQLDMSGHPYARLRPADYGAVHTITTLDMTYPLYAFIVTEGVQPVTSGTKYIVVLNGRYGYKFSADGATLHTTKDFGASAICGRPAFFEGVWHIPLAASVTAVRWTTVGVGAGADTYTAIPDSTVALHFAGPIMKDGIAQLWRAHTVNNVDASSDTTAASGGFGDDKEVGDSGIGISDLLVLVNELAVVKPDNIYRFDISGDSYRAQTFISLPLLSVYGGSNSFASGSTIYWPVGGRLWKIVGADGIPIDPSAADDYNSTAIDGVETLSSVGNAQYGAVTGWGNWLYWSTGLGILYGKIEGGDVPAWHGSLYFRAASSAPIRCAMVGPRSATTTPLLIITDDNASNKLRFLALANDGSPRADGGGLNRGAVSDVAELVLPRTDFGYQNKQKQIRSAWLRGLDTGDTGVSTQLAYVKDDSATSVNVGTAITADGYTSKALTPDGSTEFAYVARLTATITTSAGYVPSASDPRLLSLGIVAAPRTVYNATIIVATEALNATAQNQTTVLQALINLMGVGPITVVPPYSADYTIDSFTGYVLGVRETALEKDSSYGPGYQYDLEIERFTYGP